MLEKIVIWVLAADGILLLAWCVFGWLLLPGARTVTILPLSGDGENAEQTLRCRRWLENMGFVRGPLILLDCGLSENGIETAEQLADGCPDVTFCTEAELPRLWKWEQ